MTGLSEKTYSMAPLALLRFGSEAEPPIDVRRTGRQTDIGELAASIAAHGLKQALQVKEIAGEFFVADGNRRLAALRKLHEAEDPRALTSIKCELLSPVEDAEEISLALNIERVPLHEADAYVAFRSLADRGFNEHVIGERFGIDHKRVKRTLALGRLSPVILQAWRDGKFPDDARATVAAFTLAPSQEEQERIFTTLGAANCWRGGVLRMLGAGDWQIGRKLRCVGIDAYVAAGGRVVEDLFDDNHSVSDTALLMRLLDERFAAKRAELLEDGWSWAETEAGLPSGAYHSWKRDDRAKGDETPEDVKAASGCIVGFDQRAAEITVLYGVMKPQQARAEARAAARADGEAEAAPEPVANQALNQRLAAQATQAARAALADDGRLGLVTLLAGCISTVQFDAVRVKLEGLREGLAQRGETFAQAFARLNTMTADELLRVAGGIVGSALDFTSPYNPKRLPLEGSAGIIAAAIGAERMQEAMEEAWDAADYFKSAAKPLVLRAIEEAVNADEARKAGKMKRDELAAFALKNVPDTGWLPPELRASTYAGPGSEAAKAAAKKPGKKKRGERLPRVSEAVAHA